VSAPAIVHEPAEIVLTPTPCCLWSPYKTLADLPTLPVACEAHRPVAQPAPVPEEPATVIEHAPAEEPRRFGRQWALSKNFGCGDGPVHPEVRE
jgi:hypothetical protein